MPRVYPDWPKYKTSRTLRLGRTIHEKAYRPRPSAKLRDMEENPYQAPQSVEPAKQRPKLRMIVGVVLVAWGAWACFGTYFGVGLPRQLNPEEARTYFWIGVLAIACGSYELARAWVVLKRR